MSSWSIIDDLFSDDDDEEIPSDDEGMNAGDEDQQEDEEDENDKLINQRIKMTKLPDFLAKRHTHFQTYRFVLSYCNLKLQAWDNCSSDM